MTRRQFYRIVFVYLALFVPHLEKQQTVGFIFDALSIWSKEVLERLNDHEV